MKYNIKTNFLKLQYLLILSAVLVISSCNDDFLDKAPLASLSEGTFWQTENDALLALTGVYNSTKHVEEGRNFYGYSVLYLDAATDNGSFSRANRAWQFTSGELNATNGRTRDRWVNSYIRISAANNFIENIDRVDMDEDLRAEMTAEVRFMRAWQYFWMTQFFGDVPLVTNLLTVNEANSQSRTPKSQVVDFILSELDLAIADLPEQRPDEEQGRIVKAAALALKGRLLMAEERWSEASDAWKEIIDMGIYELHPNYKELFEDGGDSSNEVIYSVKYMEDVSRTQVTLTHLPATFGGWNKLQPHNSLVSAFDMTDGLPENQSPLFDQSNPYANKDPRLYATVFVPGFTSFNGMEHDALEGNNSNAARFGLALRKYTDEGHTGATNNYGGDFKHIRYAEVLLSYLESEFEANGGTATQQLLDETVNIVRARPSVNMPPIMLADFSRARMRNERRVETAWEGLRYWDTLRWKIAHEIYNGELALGAWLTDDPENFTLFPVDENGYRTIGTKAFDNPTNYLWPVPQTEFDINPGLGQNPDY